MKEIFFSLVALSFASCTSIQAPVSKPVINAMSSGNYVPGYSEKQPPFTLDVVDELNDGERLLVMLRLTPQVRWNADEVVVKLNALQNGEVVDSKDHCIYERCTEGVRSKKKAVWLEPLVSREFTISLSAGNVTDYQVELYWGNEALEYRQNAKFSRKRASPLLKSLKSERRMEGCVDLSCHYAFTLTAHLENNEDTLLESVVLGAGFVLDSANGVLPEDEEQLEVPELFLRPGQSRTFEFVLEQDIPRDLQDQVKPAIRVVSYRYKQNS